MKILFLDLDGPVIQGNEVNEACLIRIEALCMGYQAKVVIISDRRYEIDEELKRIPRPEEIYKLLGNRIVPFLHPDWHSPFGKNRLEEIEQWLDEHPDTGKFAIIDDTIGHYIPAPPAFQRRLVLCTNRHGLTVELMWQAAHLIE